MLPLEETPMSSKAVGPSRKRELLAFIVLAVLIWPFIAIGIVSGWGFLVWMYYAFTGPPGPV